MAERFQTVARNIIRLYSLCDAERTEALRKGLEEIVACVGPRRAEDWNVVGADAERLLKVWLAREGSDAARVVGEQLVDLLYELADTNSSSTATPVGSKTAPPASPVLIISDDKIVHVPSLAGGALAPSHVLTDSGSEGEADDDASTESEAAGQLEDDSEPEETTKKVEVEPDATSEQSEEEEAEEEDGEGEAEETASESESEPEELEVEQVNIRGRSYWLDVNTKKLYASVGEDDDVGDQVGEMVDGKPRFFTKTA